MIKLFSAPWCTQCVQVKKFVADMDDVVVLDINKSDDMQEYKKTNARGIPAVYNDEDGTLVVGAQWCVEYLKKYKESQ